MSGVYTKSFTAPPFDLKSALRYARASKLTPELKTLFDDCLAQCLNKTVYRVCYTELPLGRNGDKLLIGNEEVESKDLALHLDSCHSAMIFAATVGMEYDRLISGYGRLDTAKALAFQAIGTERIESLCDMFCNGLKSEKAVAHELTTERFSPGYGDLPLELQRPIFKLLSCEKRIGVYLNDSLLMTPSKSVTAIIGVKHRPDKQEFLNENYRIHKE